MAVTTLNSLQSNYAVLEKARLNKDKFAMLNVPQTEEYLRRVGVTPEDLKRLRVVHVSGTKVCMTIHCNGTFARFCN